MWMLHLLLTLVAIVEVGIVGAAISHTNDVGAASITRYFMVYFFFTRAVGCTIYLLWVYFNVIALFTHHLFK